MMPKRQPGHPDAPRAGDCGPIATERNRYFTGKYMTARDFADEQRYFLSRHRLNRLLHGWGIACGLGVTMHPDKACARRWVVVRAGIAIDCCGREVILARDTSFRLPLPWADDAGQPCTITTCDDDMGQAGLGPAIPALPALSGIPCRVHASPLRRVLRRRPQGSEPDRGVRRDRGLYPRRGPGLLGWS